MNRTSRHCHGALFRAKPCFDSPALSAKPQTCLHALSQPLLRASRQDEVGVPMGSKVLSALGQHPRSTVTQIHQSIQSTTELRRVKRPRFLSVVMSQGVRESETVGSMLECHQTSTSSQTTVFLPLPACHSIVPHICEPRACAMHAIPTAGPSIPGDFLTYTLLQKDCTAMSTAA